MLVVENSTHCINFAHMDPRSMGGIPDGNFGALVQLGDCQTRILASFRVAFVCFGPFKCAGVVINPLIGEWGVYVLLTMARDEYCG
jgi:hypothetical protein